MKSVLYKVINKLGYRIENRAKEQQAIWNYVAKFNTAKNQEMLYGAKTYLKNLDAYYKDLKVEDHKDGFIVSFDGLRIYVESVEEFFIINEVFIENDYNFHTSGKAIVIDIGANVGISSLFFSTQDYVDAIFAFEPVPDTFEQAKYNFSLNPTISRVSRIDNFGIGNLERDEVFMFNKKIKGNTGVRGKMSASYANIDTVSERQVKIRNASEVFSGILDSNQGRKVIVKMDCEGAEYEIMEDLSNSGVLSKIDVLLMEWHDKGSVTLEKQLAQAGFSFFSRRLGPNSGMLYAVKN